jgi:ferredoxin
VKVYLPKKLRLKKNRNRVKGAVIVTDGPKKKIVKEIKVDLDKCIGCRACEIACSGFHASPRYSSINPARSRIRVVIDELNDSYVPIRAGDYTPAECTGLKASNTDSAASAGFPARPGIFSKNPIPASL